MRFSIPRSDRVFLTVHEKYYVFTSIKRHNIGTEMRNETALISRAMFCD